jgi:hypothetical protein
LAEVLADLAAAQRAFIAAAILALAATLIFRTAGRRPAACFLDVAHRARAAAAIFALAAEFILRPAFFGGVAGGF